ncbi:hypothetical protein GH714_020400 [Hevea brasiliensis]|uniref:Uncharacterized protein n=1 Tax=Hevea brasiliensis TaxID=3981 RepID=A0A6A6LKZ0_HEVBR|nr:hypothetical protein GH714_020400 [Hevea brasiliensis]
MGNLSAHYHSSSSAAASPNPDSPLSDHVRDSGTFRTGICLMIRPMLAAPPIDAERERKGSQPVLFDSGESGASNFKSVPWTEEEHRLFLVGLQKLGKGDWRGIARNFVVSRTPTQVASHAQKYFIRQSNATRRKRRSSLFDMVPDMATEPQTVPEEQELPSFQSGEMDNADALPSLNLSLRPEYVPMDTASEEQVKEHDETVIDSSESKQTVPKSSEFSPIVPQLSEFPQFVPGFYPAYVPIPYPFWPANTAPLQEVKGVETSNHEVLKPVPIFPKEPVNVDELVGMSHLSIGETERGQREPSPLSLKLIGEPSRQSAFQANASAVG